MKVQATRPQPAHAFKCSCRAREQPLHRRWECGFCRNVGYLAQYEGSAAAAGFGHQPMAGSAAAIMLTLHLQAAIKDCQLVKLYKAMHPGSHLSKGAA